MKTPVSLHVSVKKLWRPLSTLFPYTTLFRSRTDRVVAAIAAIGEGSAQQVELLLEGTDAHTQDRSESTRLNSSHLVISYAVFCLKKKKRTYTDVCISMNKFQTRILILLMIRL